MCLDLGDIRSKAKLVVSGNGRRQPLFARTRNIVAYEFRVARNCARLCVVLARCKVGFKLPEMEGQVFVRETLESSNHGRGRGIIGSKC